jgi:hypothetical protein
MALATLVLSSSTILAADTEKKTTKDEASFGSLKSTDAVEAKKQAEAWLKSAGKTDADSQAKFKKIWETDRALLEKVTDTICLGDTEAAKILAKAKDKEAPAPTEVPALLTDAKKSPFYRNNMLLAYGKALATRKVYEEGLEALAKIKAEDVVDPAGYFFFKAVCEHALMIRDKADASIDRLLVDVNDAPERYRAVASHMHFDMLTWKEKDLEWVARKMSNIQRRLDLQRGGKQTQKMQKEVLITLDEMIKEIENQQKQQQQQPGDPNDGNCPPGSQQPGNDGPNTQPQSSRPQDDTKGGSASGTGDADKKKLKEIAESWGKLPEKEREKVMQELRQRLPARDRAIMDAYIKEMKKRASGGK